MVKIDVSERQHFKGWLLDETTSLVDNYLKLAEVAT